MSATLGDVTYMFTIDNDLGVDTHGIYDLILNGVVVGSISQPGLAWYLDQNGNLISQLMSASQLALDRALRDAVYDIERSDAVPHSTPGSNGSSESPPTEQLPNPNLPDNGEKPFIINLPIYDPDGPTIVPFVVTFIQPPPDPLTHAITASDTSVKITVPPHPAGALTTEATLPFADSNPGDTSFTTAVIGVTATGHINGLPNPAIAETFLHTDGVTKSVGSADGTANFAFSAPQGSFDYLSQGETVTLIYTVQVTNSNGVSDTQTVSVTLVGTNEAPVIQPLLVSDPGPIQAPAGTHISGNSGPFQPLVESNNFTFTDPNYDDTHTITVAYDAAQSNVSSSQEIGSLTATLLQDSTGGNQGVVNWDFTVDPALINALSPGKELREVFDITVADGFGGTAVKEVVITLYGPTTPTGFTWLPSSPLPPTSSGNWNVPTDWSGGVVPGAHDSATINNPVEVTINDAESVGNLTLAAGAIVDIVYPGSLTIFGTVSGAGTIELGSPGCNPVQFADPTLFVDGAVTLSGGGTIAMRGATADNMIVGVAGTNAVLLNVDYIIEGSGTIGQGDGNFDSGQRRYRRRDPALRDRQRSSRHRYRRQHRHQRRHHGGDRRRHAGD